MRVESWLFSMGSSLALLSLLWLLSSPGLQLGQCAAPVSPIPEHPKRDCTQPFQMLPPARRVFCGIAGCLLGLATVKLHSGF